MKTSTFLVTLIVFALIPTTTGFSCRPVKAPTADFFASLSAWGTWPHTGTGTSAALTRPLRVRITRLNGMQARRSAVWSAFQDWQKATGGRISFTLLPGEGDDGPSQTPGEEDILVTQCDLGPLPGGGFKTGWTDIPGLTPNTKMKATDAPLPITHAAIYLSSNRVDNDHITGIARHEIGHACGILDHSPDSRDLMYGGVGDVGIHDHQGVSEADLKTLGRIYGS